MTFIQEHNRPTTVESRNFNHHFPLSHRAGRPVCLSWSCDLALGLTTRTSSGPAISYTRSLQATFTSSYSSGLSPHELYLQVPHKGADLATWQRATRQCHELLAVVVL